MLKIAKSVEYAIFAIKYIAENQEAGRVSVKEIAEKVDIPFDLLAKIMQRLVKDGIIISHQGTYGGYSLNVSPDKISFTRLINALDQKIQFTDCMVESPTKDDCKRVADCCIRSPLFKIQNKINQVLDTTLISEIIN